MTHFSIFLAILVSFMCYAHGEYLITLNRNQTCNSQNVCRNVTNFMRSVRIRKNFHLNFVNDSQCQINRSEVVLKRDPPKGRRCVTPGGSEGTCINIKSCGTLQDFLKPPVSKKYRNYVNNHRCDELDENLVCCINCSAILGPPHPKTGCCGRDKSGETPNPDIAATTIYQYPWMVVLEYEQINDTGYPMEAYVSGGVLISSKYVLSTAQCFIDEDMPCLTHHIPETVRIGEYNLSVEGPDCVDIGGGNRECTDGAIRVPIESVYIHHGYKKEINKLFDIALVRLQYVVPYTDFVRPICLPTFDVQEDEPQTFYVTGFGSDKLHSWISNKKLHVDVPFVPLKECKKIYADITEWQPLICAGGVEGRGPCSGDAGGPLMSYKGFYELIGLVSFGRGCGKENFPDIFTKVYHFLPWIRSLIEP